MQLKKALKCQQPTYLAALLEDPSPMHNQALPQAIEHILGSFHDVMPEFVPHRLPPRREVDHQIEVEPGAKPPAFSP